MDLKIIKMNLYYINLKHFRKNIKTKLCDNMIYMLDCNMNAVANILFMR